MRILFVVEHFPALSETFVLNQITGLLDLGHDVDIYPLGLPTAGPIHPDVDKYDLMDRVWAKPPIPAPWMRRAITASGLVRRYSAEGGWKLLRTINPLRYGRPGANLQLLFQGVPFLERHDEFDIVHCHFGSNGVNALAWQEVGLLPSPLTVVFHAHEIAGFSDQEGMRLYRRLFLSEARLLPISEFWRRKLISWGATPERVTVHRMGVDCGAIEFRPRRIYHPNPIEVVTVCRLVEQKGLEYAVRAIAEVSRTFPTIKFTIVGDGPLRQPLVRLSQALGIDGIVMFVGPQSQDKVHKLLAKSHIFLAPSVTASDGLMEGIPVAIMEAMAAGLPVVSTRHSGIPELIEHNVSGMLADERDVGGLVDGLIRLIGNPSLMRGVQEKARNVVESRFNIKGLVRELERIFEQERSRG